MELITLKGWEYPEPDDSSDAPPYLPEEADGRYAGYDSVARAQPAAYLPDILIEDYNSLIWKESFGLEGAFELETYAIESTLRNLPLYSLVSLRKSPEVCIVTTRHIQTDEEGRDVLTVSGMSLLRWLMENRPTWAYVYHKDDPDLEYAKRINLVFQIPDHLSFLLWGGIVMPHAEGNHLQTGKPYELPINVVVPHTMVSQTVADKGDWYRAEWPAPLESRAETINQILELDNRYGVRTVRPQGETVYQYTPNINSLRGEGDTTEVHNNTKLRFDVYEARDRTSGDDRVSFRHDSGDIINSEYLDSVEEYKRTVVVAAEVDEEDFPGLYPPVVARILWQGSEKLDEDGNSKTTPEQINLRSDVTGIRFSMGHEGSDANLQGQGPDLSEEAEAKMRSDGLKYLKEHRDIEILTADISPHTQYKYGVHYGLGDVVLVQGKYGVTQKMIVSEYTYTSEATGEGGYPTLVKWEDPTEDL